MNAAPLTRRRSIRSQMLLLLGAMVVTAMVTWLVLASRVVTADKLASVYDVNALLASSISEQVEATVDSLADKLRYFAQEQLAAAGNPDARARSLFDADDEVLSLELFQRDGAGWKKRLDFVDNARLAALNLTSKDLDEARKQTPVDPEAVVQAGLQLQNASLAPDIALLRLSVATHDGSAVAVADLRPERLLRVVGKSELYRVFVVDSQGQVVAHADPRKVLSHQDLSNLPVVKDALDQKVARGTSEYKAGDEELVASYARVEKTRLAVIVEAPRAEVFNASRELTRRTVLFAIAVISLSLIAAVYFSRRLTRPLRELESTMVKVSRGDFNVQVPVQSNDEIGSVASAFNQMTHELGRRSDELDQKNAQLVQSEKLSAIGELSAGLAHEVKNPMVGIVGFAQLGQESTSLDEARDYFKLIDEDAQRANSILMRLLEFARPEVSREVLQVNPVVDGSVKLVTHPLQLAGVRVQTRYAEDLPPILGNSNQLRQVLVNLMMNAGQALEAVEKRQVFVETAKTSEGVVISVRDTGPGMSEQVRSRLFEPFFTTKPRGKGTGLGLSISRSIIEEHRGEIRVESAPGQGATFFITLPATVTQGPPVG